MDKIQVKQEVIEHLKLLPPSEKPAPSTNVPISLIDLDSSDYDSSSASDDDDDGPGAKRKKLDGPGVALPVGFLDPLPPKKAPPVVSTVNGNANVDAVASVKSCKQFWKAGDYEGASSRVRDITSGGMDHVRVHPKFLHSNATSHKWVLGAFAELLDNSLDEVCNGATYVNIDMQKNKKDGSKMLLIEDNGGGMDPEKMRQCMSLGYSMKSKIADTIGQYGNGFKTSTMRLGADVIVFSRCRGNNEKRSTQSIGLLSYTFLRSTGKEDIVVPMLDYERGRQQWNKMIRSSAGDWNKNVETIVHWSPFLSEEDLLQQFDQMKDQGTRIIVYNLWEDDQGQLELDFTADRHDIQIRGVNRDEKNIEMAKQYPNSRHFLTYRHSLRSYASILYLRIPPGFRIILRGKDVDHHSVVNDMMLSEEITYRPQPGSDGVPKDSNIVAEVTIGFVKDAKAHIDVQGFNVYHKNRLIKPFWRLWNVAGSDGRGVIGVLEANFIEPAHDKQGFERTTVLARLEARLVQMQKTYWRTKCHKIGYAPRNNKRNLDDKETAPEYIPQTSGQSKNKYNSSSSNTPTSGSEKFYSSSNRKQGGEKSVVYSKTFDKMHQNGNIYSKGSTKARTPKKSGNGPSSSGPSSPSGDNVSDNDMLTSLPKRQANGSYQRALPVKDLYDGSRRIRPSLPLENTESEQDCSSNGGHVRMTTRSQFKGNDVNGKDIFSSGSGALILDQLKEQNYELREILKRKEEEIHGDLLRDLQDERNKCKLLEAQLQEAKQKIEELNKEQESLITLFSEERGRRDMEVENLRKKLKDASNTIQELLDKVRMLENLKSPNAKFRP